MIAKIINRIIFCCFFASLAFCNNACTEKTANISFIDTSTNEKVISINYNENGSVNSVELSGNIYTFDKDISQFKRELDVVTLQRYNKKSNSYETFTVQFNNDGKVSLVTTPTKKIEYKYDGVFLNRVTYSEDEQILGTYMIDWPYDISTITIMAPDGIVELVPTYASYYSCPNDFDLAMYLIDGSVGRTGEVTCALRTFGLLGKASSYNLIKQWSRFDHLISKKEETTYSLDYIFESDTTLSGVIVGDTSLKICYSNREKSTYRISDSERQNQRQNSIIESERVFLTPTKEMNGYRYVDLGLSVMWAECNIGADRNIDYGNHYAWGETNTKNCYFVENSKTMDKYMHDISGSYENDVARQSLGSPWRIPTKKEIDELIEECTWTRGEIYGVYGYIVTGPNGNRIFLPNTGYYSYDELINSEGEIAAGYYWSSTPDDITGAYSLYTSVNYRRDWIYEVTSNLRSDGYAVRPVFTDR